MADQTRGLSTHRRWIPAWHFFTVPVLVGNVAVVVARFARDPSINNGWAFLVSLALLIGIVLSRNMPLRAQDRIIRLEERIRFERVLPSRPARAHRRSDDRPVDRPPIRAR